MFSSLQYKSVQRNNHTISFLLDGNKCYGIIVCFVGVLEGSRLTILAIVETFDIDDNPILPTCMKKVSRSSTSIVKPVSLNNILSQFVHIKVESNEYISTFPNKVVALLDVL